MQQSSVTKSSEKHFIFDMLSVICVGFFLGGDLLLASGFVGTAARAPVAETSRSTFAELPALPELVCRVKQEMFNCQEDGGGGQLTLIWNP